MAIWDKRDDETALAYDAFTTYYQMPARERGIDAAWRASAGRARAKRAQMAAPRHWYGWSSSHAWVARAAAYDQHLAEQDRLLWEERRRQVKRADWDDGDAMRQLTRDALPHARQFIHQQRRVIEAHDGQPQQVIVTLSFDVVGLSRVLAEASKLQRLATDEPTENFNLSGAALQSVIEAEFRRLAAMDDDAATATAGLLTADEDAEEDSGL